MSFVRVTLYYKDFWTTFHKDYNDHDMFLWFFVTNNTQIKIMISKSVM